MSTVAATPPSRHFARIHVYSRVERDPEDQEKEVKVELAVTRSVNQTEVKLSRTRMGRTTEIDLRLSDEERRELGRLLS